MSVERGTEAMLTRRRQIVAQGARPLGWKIGFNVESIQERLGLDGPVVGFLTTETVIEDSWDEHPVLVESEVAVELGDDSRSIAALFPALELTDPPDLEIELEQILAGNIFHRAVAFGPRAAVAAPGAARISVNGELRHTIDDAGARLEEMVEVAERRLGDAGAELHPGDRIITGVLAPPHRAEPGDVVRLELEDVGSVELRFS